MTQQHLNVGTTANDGTGDLLRSAFQKVEANFSELYTAVASPVTEADQTLSDVTTNNVSTTKHGYVPKAPNDATKYLDGTGAWSVPAGGGGGASVTISTTAPSSPSAGNLWWKSDEGVMLIYYNDGTSSQWVSASPAGPSLSWTNPDIAPPLSSWFATTANTPVLTDQASYGLAITGAGGGTTVRYAVKALPAADITIVTRIVPNLWDSNSFVGIVFRDSSGGKVTTFGPATVSNAKINALSWTNATTANTDIANINYAGGPVWLKAKRTNSTGLIDMWVSGDGIIWKSFVTGNNWVTTANQYGIGVWSTTTSSDPSGIFTYWNDGTTNGSPLVLSKVSG